VKKLRKLFALGVAVLALGVLASSAFAFSFVSDYAGPIKFKFSNYSVGSLYFESSEGGYGYADGEEDAWGIFKVSSIATDDLNETTLWFDGKDGEQLTGMYYGIDDDYWLLDDSGLTIESVGGQIDLYLDSTTAFDANLGPSTRSGVASYPKVTDGILFLSTDFGTGIKFNDGDADNDYITYHNQLTSNTSPFTGGGSFYLDVTGGAYADMFESNRWVLTDDNGNTVYRDFFGQFDTTTSGAGPWLVKSEDPIQGAYTPEPASMILMGIGLVGAVLRRKRVLG